MFSVQAVKRLFSDEDVTSIEEVNASETAPEAMDCCNCGTELAGKFCHHCGQRADIRRLTFSSLLREAIRRGLDLDSAYLRTFIGMIRHPGLMASRYVSGDRKPYANPLKFLIFTITLTVLVRLGVTKIGLWETDPGLIGNHKLIYYTLQQVLLAGALALLFYRSERNFVENVAFSLFMGGPAFVYMSIAEFIAFHAFGPEHWGSVPLITLAFVGYLLQGGTGFYDERLWWVVPKMTTAAIGVLFGLVILIVLVF